jgi:hypothetical protein
MPRLFGDTQAETYETPPVIIIAIPAPASTSPVIWVTVIRKIGTEQEVLSDGSDEIIMLDFSRIGTNAAIMKLGKFQA